MKKLLLAVVALIFAWGAMAQSEITIGPKVGWNITNISNSHDKNKLSFVLGGFAEFKISDLLSIQPEILYSRQGTRDKGNGVKVKNRLNYLNIPVLAKLNVWDELSVEVGPQFGFALNARQKTKAGGEVVKRDIQYNNTFDFSFAFGVSYNLENLMFSARYNVGLTNVIEKDHFGGNNNKNHVFQLSVGYRFGDLF